MDDVAGGYRTLVLDPPVTFAGGTPLFEAMRGTTDDGDLVH